MNVQPKQKHNSDKMPIDTTSSQPCIKPHVVGSQSLVDLVSKQICDVDAYLKKVNEYIEKCKKESG